MRAVPVVMVRNEEYTIGPVLNTLRGFPLVLLGDTGSTDRTRGIASRYGNVRVTEFGELDPKRLGVVRQELAVQGISFGYDWGLLIDGDELYFPEALQAILSEGMPQGKRLGFTTNLALEMHKGEVWMLDNKFNRTTVFWLRDAWIGEYPFECPETFAYNRTEQYHYYNTLPDGLYVHGYHLHRFRRSPDDDAVYKRREKRFKFSMQNQVHARLRVVDRWPCGVEPELVW